MKAASPPGDFRKVLESISHRHDTRRVFDGFVRMAACALAAEKGVPLKQVLAEAQFAYLKEF